MMTCFEWRKLTSDYLDGTLISPKMREADQHLDECEGCKQQTERFRKIVSVISSQPRSQLPVPIRKSPLSFILPRLGDGIRSSRWDRTPWLIRSGIEGLGITFGLVLLVATIPRLRAIYERSLDRNFNSFSLADLYPGAKKQNDALPQTVRGKMATLGEDQKTSDEFNGEVDSEEEPTSDEESPLVTDDPEVRVGNSEIWRFNLRTDSPREFQPKVVELLSSLNLPATTPGLGGVEVPGGIQFDLLVPKTAIAPLKKQLQKLSTAHLTPAAEPEAAPATSNEAFTWYKTKSKRAIPSGKIRIVIWLSQI